MEQLFSWLIWLEFDWHNGSRNKIFSKIQQAICCKIQQLCLCCKIYCNFALSSVFSLWLLFPSPVTQNPAWSCHFFLHVVAVGISHRCLTNILASKPYFTVKYLNIVSTVYIRSLNMSEILLAVWFYRFE